MLRSLPPTGDAGYLGLSRKQPSRSEQALADLAPTRHLVSFHGGHTLFDGAGDPAEFVERAIELGFLAYGFSEHMPPPEPYTYTDFPGAVEGRRRFDRYVETVARLRAEYRGQIDVLLGIEIEYLPDRERAVLDYLDDYAFDYTVGSVHFIDEFTFDLSQEVYDRGVFAHGGMDAWVEEYYSRVRQLLALGVTDVLGHLDLIKIFAEGDYRSARVRDAETETLEAAKRAGVILDVNARGLKKPCAEIYPTDDLLAAACGMGIPATLGDDSHAVEEVGARLDQATDAMRRAGYESLTALVLDNDAVVRTEVPL